MKHNYILFFFLIIIIQIIPARGLKFGGNEQPIDNRTSFDIFNEKKSIAFEDNFDIDFNISLDYKTRVGHIVRIKNKNSRKIYNLLYESHEGYPIFRLNEEGKSSLIIAKIDKEYLTSLDWITINIAFNLKKKSIILLIDNYKFEVKDLDLPITYKPNIIFGKSDYIIDVPSFAIRNLSIGNGKKKYFFPLKENEGNIVHDLEGKPLGYVINPEWMINDAYGWKLKIRANSKTIAGSEYNQQKKEIYYFNKDSIFIFNTKNNSTKTILFENECPVNLALASTFIDTKYNKLYVYEPYYNTPHYGPTVASLDLNTYEWKVESYDLLNKELHHHGALFDPQTRSQIIFGGYGNNMYSNIFYTYNLDSTKWQPLTTLHGDIIFPRYFLSMGFNKDKDAAYIFGGMGNESGEHIVGRKYFYDLFSIDLKTKTIKRLWEIPWDGDNVVPARNLIFDNDSSFYVLCYPEHVSKSFLKLYQFSIKDGSFRILGDSIEIYSDRISTHAKLYYDKDLSSLFTIIQESNDDVTSDIKVYSLAYPPISKEELGDYPKESYSVNKIIYILSIISLFIICCVTYLFLKNKQSNKHLVVLENLPENNIEIVRANSIYLFGTFTVFNRQKKDVTHLFSTRLKQTLCLILEYSDKDGISSQRLSNILWPEKPEDKVKNSRGVTINHLRKALAELDGVELVHNKGYFKIKHTDLFYCDYTKSLDIVSKEIETDKESTELLNILNRGKFLQNSNEALFDSIKTKIENCLEPVLLKEINKNFIAKNYSRIIEISKATFQLDSLNENALSYEIKALIALKMDNEAQARYQSFIIEYKKSMGNSYPIPFQDLIQTKL